jgi:hypothetical protein
MWWADIATCYQVLWLYLHPLKRGASRMIKVINLSFDFSKNRTFISVRFNSDISRYRYIKMHPRYWPTCVQKHWCPPIWTSILLFRAFSKYAFRITRLYRFLYRRPDVNLHKVPNRIVAVDAWMRSACYPRGSFYPLSCVHTTTHRRITMTYFRICSTCESRS